MNSDFSEHVTASLFTLGLSLPAVYAAVVPGTYLQIWLRILSPFTLGIGALIFILGLVKASLLLSGTSKKIDNWSNGRVVKYGIGIHVGIGILVLLSILGSRAQASNSYSAMEVTYAFIATEMLVFPIIGIAYLARSLHNAEQNYVTVFLLSAAVYLDIVLVVIAEMLMAAQGVSLSPRTALEVAGARISFLLGAFAAFATTPSFWDSQSFYSIDVLHMPNWIGSVYALTMALYVYRGTSEGDIQSIVGAWINNRLPPTNRMVMACNILIATLLALVAVSAAHLIFSPSIIGNLIQLLIYLLALGFVAYFASRVQ
jgi:hypothetical protein